MVRIVDAVRWKRNGSPISTFDELSDAHARASFFHRGKVDRHDVYQAPYIWVQFMKPKPNVLINVICRVFGQNIDFDRKAGRALTRMQIYVKDLSKRAASRKIPDS